MPLSYRFMVTGAIFGALGMLLGLYMGPSQDFRLVPVHVHINLIGWVSMMLFGLYYGSDQLSATTRLAHWHFWVALVGLLLFATGLTFLRLGNPSLEIALILGGVLSLLSLLIFLWVLWQASARTSQA